MKHAPKTIQETVALPADVYGLVVQRAKANRLTVSDYLSRILKTSIVKEYIEIADEETEKAIAEAREDIKNGRYIRVRAGDDRMLRKVLWGE